MPGYKTFRVKVDVSAVYKGKTYRKQTSFASPLFHLKYFSLHEADTKQALKAVSTGKLLI
jgi:hypothetical protein